MMPLFKQPHGKRALDGLALLERGVVKLEWPASLLVVVQCRQNPFRHAHRTRSLRLYACPSIHGRQQWQQLLYGLPVLDVLPKPRVCDDEIKQLEREGERGILLQFGRAML